MSGFAARRSSRTPGAFRSAWIFMLLLGCAGASGGAPPYLADEDLDAGIGAADRVASRPDLPDAPSDRAPDESRPDAMTTTTPSPGDSGAYTGMDGVPPDAGVAARRLPNVIVFLADDLGWGSVGSYGADPALVRTPNIDRLAREGRRFTDASTTSSVCTPTRYSLLTGRYNWRSSLKAGTLGSQAPMLIEPGRLTIASLLGKRGYRTAAIGKWHLGYTTARVDFTKPIKPGPLELGFDYHFGVPSNHGDNTGIYVENHGVLGLGTGGGPYVPYSGGQALDIPAPRRVDDQVMPTLTDKAVGWIEQQSAVTPFFLYFAPVAVHNPVTPQRDLVGSSKAGTYGDWIHELDRSLGRILESLDRKGIADETLIIFTSDNGGVFRPQNQTLQTAAYQAGLKINGPFRGGKHDVWEGGFRVPFIVRWPGRAPAGTASDQTISVVDVLATLAAAVGEPLPPAAQAAEDSHDMLPAFLGQEPRGQIRPDIVDHSAYGVFALREGPWKYVEGVPAPGENGPADQRGNQLYNLTEDPGELRDRARENPEIVRRLAARLQTYRDRGYSRP